MAKKKTARAAASRKKTTRKKAPARSAGAPKKKATKKAARKVAKKAAKKVVKKSPKKVAKKAPSKKTTRSVRKAPTSKKTTTKKTSKAAATTRKKTTKKSTGAATTPKPVRVPFGAFDRSAMKEGQKAAARLAAAAGIAAPDASTQVERTTAAPQKRLKKSPLTKKQLNEFRAILLRKRAEIVGDVDSMETEALSGGGSGSLSRLPQHMADQGSDTYDQSLALDLAASQRGLLREIDEALAKIADGTYGICEVTGGPIDIERLQAKPWARLSIEAARMQER